MGTTTSIGDRCTHRGQHRTLSPMAKVVPYGRIEILQGKAATERKTLWLRVFFRRQECGGSRTWDK